MEASGAAFLFSFFGGDRRSFIRIVSKASALVGLGSYLPSRELFPGNEEEDSGKKQSLLVQAIIAGEVTQRSVILQGRLGEEDGLSVHGDLPGIAGQGYFEISSDGNFGSLMQTGWLEASPTNDYHLKTTVDGLEPGTRYYYRIRARRDDTADLMTGRMATFRTLPAERAQSAVSFVMMSCANFEKFYGIGDKSVQQGAAQWTKPVVGEERRLGMQGFEEILNVEPDFWVSNGDNVYYDEPDDAGDPSSAKTQEELRAKWHRQFSMPRLRRLLEATPVYFLKDDHDYRFNDADPTDRRFEIPSDALGRATFCEQAPVVSPADAADGAAKTYRTHRVNKLLQIWMTEVRDHRSPNVMPDGPEKTLWGEEQKEWLKRTLLESDATFKVIISPTPEVGPDGAYKKDNHINLEGFRHEGDAFKEWLAEHDLVSPSVFVIDGDRHWQYHSIHPTGLEEFGCGSLNAQNSREGVVPGEPNSTDPEGLIEQPYLQSPPVGGFLQVKVAPPAEGKVPSILFAHYSERGNILNAVRRYAITE